MTLRLAALLLVLPLAVAAQAPPSSRAAQPPAANASGAADCKPGDLPAARYERRLAPATERELAMARTAWKYFENNTQPTGLANAVDDYPSTTMWDTAS